MGRAAWTEPQCLHKVRFTFTFTLSLSWKWNICLFFVVSELRNYVISSLCLSLCNLTTDYVTTASFSPQCDLSSYVQFTKLFLWFSFFHWKLVLIIKPTRCTNFWNLFFWIKLYMFRTVPLSIISSFTLNTQQWYMSYRFADSLLAGAGRNWFRSAAGGVPLQQQNSSWWTEELSEICRVLFQK